MCSPCLLIFRAWQCAHQNAVPLDRLPFKWSTSSSPNSLIFTQLVPPFKFTPAAAHQHSTESQFNDEICGGADSTNGKVFQTDRWLTSELCFQFVQFSFKFRQQVEELVICILRHTYLNIHHTLRTKVKYDETIKHHQHIGINIALSLDEDLMICLPWWFFLFELDHFHFLALIIVFVLNTFTF